MSSQFKSAKAGSTSSVTRPAAGAILLLSGLASLPFLMGTVVHLLAGEMGGMVLRAVPLAILLAIVIWSRRIYYEKSGLR